MTVDEPWFFKMDEEYGIGTFWSGKEFLDRFETNKNYYMWVKSDYYTYRFTVERKEFKNMSSDYDLWLMFDLKEIDAKNLHWLGRRTIGRINESIVAIPEQEQVTGPFAKTHWGDRYTSILSEKSYIWIKVDNHYITPNFLDIPSFLYRELLLAWEKTGSRNDQLKIWFEEIIVPMSINRRKI